MRDNWRPIAEYDALPAKDRPRRAAFYFKSEPRPNRPDAGLGATVQVERNYGFRTCTHWLPLPPDPQESGQ